MKLENTKKYIFIALLIASAILIFWNILQAPIQGWDEGTNAEIVYESLHSDDPFNLKLFGEKFFEKPPLWYYLTELSVYIFGYNEFGIRFISSLSALGIVLMTFLIAKKFFSFKVGILSVLTLLATRILFFNNIRGLFASHTLVSADLDSLHIFLILISSYFFLTFFKGKISTHFYLGIFASVLSYMTKGPMGFLPIIIVILFLILNWKKSYTSGKTILVGLSIFLLTILPWHIFQTVLHGGNFINSFFYYHIFARSIGAIEGHSENIFYYVEVLLRPETIPLLLTTPAGVIFGTTKNKLKANFPRFYLVSFLIITFILISAIQTKLSWYVFYLLPFAAIFSAIALENLSTFKGITSNLYKVSLAILIFLLFGNIFSILTIEKSPFNRIKTYTKDATLITNSLPSRDELFYLRKHNYSYVIINEDGTCNKPITPKEENGCIDQYNICQMEHIIRPLGCNQISSPILVKKENLNLSHRYLRDAVIHLDEEYLLLK